MAQVYDVEARGAKVDISTTIHPNTPTSLPRTNATPLEHAELDPIDNCVKDENGLDEANLYVSLALLINP